MCVCGLKDFVRDRGKGMKIHTVIASSLLILSAMACAQTQRYEYPRSESLPEDDTSIFPRDPALLTHQDLHMSGERFFQCVDIQNQRA